MNKLTPEALQAAKNLVIKYRSITPKDVDNALNRISPRVHLSNLTGFGSIFTCKLCINSDSPSPIPNCFNCIHGYDHRIICNNPCTNTEYFNDIDEAIDNKDKEAYLKAVKLRADYIQSRIDKYQEIKENL